MMRPTLSALFLIYLLLDIATKIYAVYSPLKVTLRVTGYLLAKTVFTILSETSAIAASTHLIKFLRIMANATLIPKNVLLISSALKMLFLPLLAKTFFNRHKPVAEATKINQRSIRPRSITFFVEKSSVVTVVVLWEVILAPHVINLTAITLVLRKRGFRLKNVYKNKFAKKMLRKQLLPK